MRKVFFLAVSVGLAALVGVSAIGAATSSGQANTVVITTKTLPKLGPVLVTSTGLTLYMFVPDKQKTVTCVGSCAAIWPPLKLPTGAKAVAKGQVKAKLLGSDPNPAGGRVVTYNKWPLYTYVVDTKPGMAKGQAINLNGGLWYVLAPSGKVIKAKP